MLLWRGREKDFQIKETKFFAYWWEFLKKYSKDLVFWLEFIVIAVALIVFLKF